MRKSLLLYSSIVHVGALCGVLLYGLLLTSCSTPSMAKLTADEIAKIDTWHWRGKIAVNFNNQGHNANLSWLQSKEQATIKVYGPLNTHQFTVVSDLNNFTITRADGSRINPEDINYKIPFSAMTYWLRGSPIPQQATNNVVFTPNSHSKFLSFEQLGWHITYKRYHPNIPALPQFLVLTKQHNGQQVKVKVFIRNWRLR